MADKTLSFAGYTPISGTIPWQDILDEGYNDDHQLMLETKKKYTQEEPDGRTFTYRYVIHGMDMYGLTGDPEQAQVCLSLYLAPEPEYWEGEALESAVKCCGYEGLPEDQWRSMFSAADSIEHGMAVYIDREWIKYDPKEHDEGFYDILDCPGIKELLDTAASILPGVNALRGFHIDRPQNRLGSTGWDTLKYALGGKDPIQAQIDRIRNGNNPL